MEYSNGNIIQPEVHLPLSDLVERPTQVFDRLHQSGEAELLTIDGRACAVLMSPTAYDELLAIAFHEYDVKSIERSMKEIEAGHYMEVGEFFDQLHAKLLKMKADSLGKEVFGPLPSE
jgi:hypothetical protein